MNQSLRRLILKAPFYSEIRLWNWKRQGMPVPPPHVVKQITIKNFAKKYGLKVLVETGTLHGDMVEAMKPYFEEIYSIELSEELYKKAKQRFDGDRRINIIHGDSGIEIGKLVSRIDSSALFWLDGHYSGGPTAKSEKDTPIFEELTHILNSQQSSYVIIIDDARCFGTDPAYPSIEELSNFIKAKNSTAQIELEIDSIIVVSH